MSVVAEELVPLFTAATNVFVDKKVEVGLQLGIQILLKPPLAEYVPQS